MVDLEMKFWGIEPIEPDSTDSVAFKSLKTNIFDKEPEQAGINLKEQWLKYGIFDAVKLIKEK